MRVGRSLHVCTYIVNVYGMVYAVSIETPLLPGGGVEGREKKTFRVRRPKNRVESRSRACVRIIFVVCYVLYTM